jgi:hypothetical protein
MPTINDRYTAATDYVRRALSIVEAAGVAYSTNPVTGMIEWYAGRTKTVEPRNELAQIEARWRAASSDAQRAAIAREAELLADRVEESVPGAPQDRDRTNLYAGEIATATPATTYGQELDAQANEEWQWIKDTASVAKDRASSFGKWLLVGGAAVLSWKALDYLRERERSRQSRAESTEQRLNRSLERVAQRRSGRP